LKNSDELTTDYTDCFAAVLLVVAPVLAQTEKEKPDNAQLHQGAARPHEPVDGDVRRGASRR
jgi:hypothetical protein